MRCRSDSRSVFISSGYVSGRFNTYSGNKMCRQAGEPNNFNKASRLILNKHIIMAAFDHECKPQLEAQNGLSIGVSDSRVLEQ